MEKLDLCDALKPELIDISDSEFKDKEDLFEHMSEMFYKSGCIEDIDEFKKALYEREDTGSTYMGDYLAVPHGKSSTVKNAAVAICRSKPFMYNSNNFSGEVKLSVMLAIPEESSSNEYIKMLSTVTRLLMDQVFVDVLLNGNDANTIVKTGVEQAKKLSPLS